MKKTFENKPIEANDVTAGLARHVATAPAQPGVYLFKNDRGRILYVGKARNLRKRLQSYFQSGRPHDAKTRVLLKKITGYETIITGTEKEALILESNLIKRHRPRYNVVLKDDKRYPALRLNTNQPFANLNIVRKIKNDGALYFGPYSSAGAVRQTLKFIHKTFQLRKCRNRTFKNRTRPCLNYQMRLCLGPCCMDVKQEAYQSVVNEVIAFLRGRTPALIQKVKQEMLKAAQSHEFEKAAALRDKMFALEKTLERQVSVTTDFKDRDVIGMAIEDSASAAAMLRVRGGYLLGSRQFNFATAAGSMEDQMGAVLSQFYHLQQRVPEQIFVSHMPRDVGLIEAQLSEIGQRRVHIVAPIKGEKARLVRMAVENARKTLQENLLAEAANKEMLARLQKRLRMERPPLRIECFDNSNMAGTQPVSAMSVFENGLPRPEACRRYRIRFKGKPDDYAYMAEVLNRRFDNENRTKPSPDLLLLDGGKGQLNVAMAVLETLQQQKNFAVAAIAKKDESIGETLDKIYLPGRSNPVQFGKDMDLLLFLQRIRDDAHRLAVTYQRKRRSARGLTSTLDAVPGVGPRRKAHLMKAFGSISKIASAAVEDLSALPGISESLAETIKQTLSGRQGCNGN
jgi:excinuclease ABC subunit C